MWQPRTVVLVSFRRSLTAMVTRPSLRTTLARKPRSHKYLTVSWRFNDPPEPSWIAFETRLKSWKFESQVSFFFFSLFVLILSYERILFFPFFLSVFFFWNIDASVPLYRNKSVVGPTMGTIIRAKVHYPNESRVFEKRLREINRIVKEN